MPKSEGNTVKRINYQRGPCGRCGGSGHYSFNQRDGTRCYGCGGSGQRLTPAGKRAFDRIESWKKENLDVSPAELEVGDLVVVDSFFSKDRVWEVTGTYFGSDRGGSVVDGEVIPSWTVDLRSRRSGRTMAYGCSAIRRAATGKHWDALVDFAGSLKLKGLAII